MSLSSHSRSFFKQLLEYTQQKSLPKGRALHAQIIRTGSSSCIFIANSVVNLYAKCGDLHRAQLVFETIFQKDVVSWNCLINAYPQMGSSGSSMAMELFRRMRADNTFPNAHTFSGFFTAASNIQDIFGGQQGHTLAIKTSSFNDVFVGSSLLNLYCKVGLLCDARRVFDVMPQRSSVSWATMISGYATQTMPTEALSLFESMRREEQCDNEFIYTSVLSALKVPEFCVRGKQIHSLSVKNGLLAFVAVINAIVTMYAKCGYVDDALQTFHTSDDKNSITWSAMVTGFTQGGHFQKALKFFTSMHFSGNTPSEFTFVGAINACSDLGAVEEGKQLHGYSLKLGFESQIYVMTALVDMYAKCGSLVDAFKGFNCLPQPDRVLWTSMIGGYVQNGENECALSLYCRMLMQGIEPNELTMTSVIKACANLAALEQGKQVHACTIKYGLSPEIEIGSALSTMYAKCGILEDGNLVFRRMPKRDVISWNAMISGLAQNGQGKDALALFEEMLIEGTKPDSVTIVNVLSACSHMGLVDRAWGYFDMMSIKFGISPGLEHYACMVDVLSRAGKLNEAKSFIESSKIDHGMCLWRILLGACRNYRNYELGAYAGEKLIELASQESSAYVLLASIYAALGKKEDEERVRRMMKFRGVSKEPGCSWIELNCQVHVFVVGDEMHPQIRDIRIELRRLRKHLKDEGYVPRSEVPTTF